MELPIPKRILIYTSMSASTNANANIKSNTSTAIHTGTNTNMIVNSIHKMLLPIRIFMRILIFPLLLLLELMHNEC